MFDPQAPTGGAEATPAFAHLSFPPSLGLGAALQSSRTRWLGAVATTEPLCLETLWQLCAQLQARGHRTVVLDACSQESHEAPGLLQRLQQGAAALSALCPQEPALWPSALGLQELLQSHSAPNRALAQLQPAVQGYHLAIIHAPATWLGALLQSHEAMPLVLTTPSIAATQQAYRDIKQLALHTGLTSQVCTLMQGFSYGQESQARTQITTLERCAADYLGLSLPTQIIDAHNRLDLQRLALQLLENGRTITGDGAPAWHAPAASGQSHPFVLSH